jgi:hypothetical protein
MTVKELLKECGAVMLRKSKHEIWRLPNGQKFIVPISPSDKRTEANQLSDLKRLLGITKHETTVGERREKRRTLGRPEQRTKHAPTATLRSFREELSKAVNTHEFDDMYYEKFVQEFGGKQ